MWHLYYVNTEGCRTAKRLKKQTTIFFGRSKTLASVHIGLNRKKNNFKNSELLVSMGSLKSILDKHTI